MTESNEVETYFRDDSILYIKKRYLIHSQNFNIIVNCIRKLF